MPISFGEAVADITIDLDRPAGPYYPGDVIHAALVLESRKDVQVRQFSAGLLAWELCISEDSDGDSSRTTTLNEFVTEETLVADMTLAAGFRGSYRLDLPVPRDAFPPYQSSTIHSGWLVKAVLDRGLKKDVTAEVPVPLVVPPPGERAQPGEVGEASHPDQAGMRLWLPRLDWVEGETVEGRLLVNARKGFDAGQVRVQLVRREKVHTSRHKLSNTDWIDRVELAGKTRFEVGQAAEFDFGFDIPVMGCPTRHTEATTVTYTLQGVLGRRLRKDLTVDAELRLYNGQ
jgi:hypothetical protein